jgi:hypothetical protein
LTTVRLLLTTATVTFLAAGCTGPSRPPAAAPASADDSGVTVVVVQAVGPDGTQQVRVTFTPQQAGFHLYSIDMPPDGVDGLGVPTQVVVRGGLQASASPVANQPVRQLRIEDLNVDLPVYPDGPVTVTVPVHRVGNGPAQVVVTYGACSLSTCLRPVHGWVITLS